MRKLFNSLFGSGADRPTHTLPEGERVYAVGDIHGRADLFRALIDAVDLDDQTRGRARTTIILLGDLVDRGPDSAQVIQLAREWQNRRDVRILAGNHEEMFLLSFDKVEVLRSFLRWGGKETLLSYGYDEDALLQDEYERVQEQMAELVPQADREFVASFEDQIRMGDYLFVHAGVDPFAPLDEQKRNDLLWIREPFLSHKGKLEALIVHGHTISDGPEELGHRIGIDTGAYQSGQLTALMLEGTEKHYLVTAEKGGTITVEGVTEA